MGMTAMVDNASIAFVRLSENLSDSLSDPRSCCRPRSRAGRTRVQPTSMPFMAIDAMLNASTWAAQRLAGLTAAAAPIAHLNACAARCGVRSGHQQRAGKREKDRVILLLHCDGNPPRYSIRSRIRRTPLM